MAAWAVGFRLKRVGIFAATRWERQAIQDVLSVDTIQHDSGYYRVFGRRGRCQVVLVQTGIGPARARAVCQAVLQNQPLDVAISSGLACALTASSIGELFIGTEVITARTDGAKQLRAEVMCDQAWADLALRSAHAEALPARAGRFVSLPRIIFRGNDKRRVAIETGAVALDMESAAIGAMAAEHRTPFAVIRAVSDLLDEDLPLDFNLFLEPTDWLKGAWTCVSRPASLLGLRRMRTQMRTASRRITAVFERLLDDVDHEGIDR
ncbi:5'-methylthioadenosine/S-adenosylhomocysteine nucleosidase family protein [Nitrospira sp. Nam74]